MIIDIDNTLSRDEPARRRGGRGGARERKKKSGRDESAPKKLFNPDSGELFDPEEEARQAQAEAARARERRATDATRLARRETADRERQARADRLAARLGPEGRARLDMMLAARAAAKAARALGRRRLLERDLDEERNVCIEGREVLMGMTRGVG